MISPTISNSTPEPDVKISLLLAVIAAVAAGAATAWAASLFYDFNLAPTAWATIQAVLDGAKFSELPNVIKNTILGGGTAALLAAIITLIFMLRVTTPPEEIHLRGRQLISDPEQAKKAAVRAAATESKRLGTGLEIMPGVNLSLERETRHMMILGSIGAGKTTILRPLIDKARARGDKCFIFDFKSDFIQALPGKDDTGDEGDEILFIAPWDSRGYAWDLAADIQNFQDAREFSSLIVPDAPNDNPIWVNSSREILTAMIRRCQVQLPRQWTLEDVVVPLNGGVTAVQRCVFEYNPLARLLIEEVTRTTHNMMSNLVSNLSPFLSLIDAWSRCEVPGRISIRQWLSDDYAGPRTIVLQANKTYSVIQKTVSEMLLNIFSREMCSPAVTDVPPDDPRKIWLFLDEFPQLGKLDEFSSFLEVGRSKGIRVVMGLQNKAQLTKIYGAEEMESWSSIVGTFIVGRTQGPEISSWLADLIGERKYKKYSPTYSSPLYNQSEAPSRTDQYQIIEEHVISPSEFQSLLGEKRGMKALLLTGGNEVFLLRWPHLDPETKKQRRPASVPARWTDPDFPSAADQILSDASNNASTNDSNNKKQGDMQRKTKKPSRPLQSSRPVVADDHSELKRAAGELAEESSIHDAAEELLPAGLFDIATPIGHLKLFSTAISMLLDRATPAVTPVATQPPESPVVRKNKRKKRPSIDAPDQEI